MNITLNGIKITQDSKTLAFEKNNNVDEIVITVDTDESWSYKLDVKYPDKFNIGKDALYNIIDLGRNGNICSVILTREMLPFNGKYTMQLRGINGDKVYHSDTFEVWVKYSIEPGPTYNPVPSEFYQVEARLDNKVDEAKQYAENAKIASTRMPKISPDNTWLIWDAETGDYVDTGIMASGDSVTVDGELSDTSVNPVQNRVVKSALDSLSEEIADLEGKIPSGVGSGLTDDEKTLMLSLFQNAVFNDIDMSATLNQLKNLFNGGEPNTYSVTYNLTDVTSDNTAEVAKEAFPFTATLTATEGLEINKFTLSVTMGGVDITDSVFVDGVITIPIVTGDIVIKAEGLEEGLVYDSGDTIVFNADRSSIDTGFDMFGADKAFTVYVDGGTEQWNKNLLSVIFDNPPNADYGGQGLSRNPGGNGSWVWKVHYSLDIVSFTPVSAYIKLALVKQAGNTTATVYALINGNMNTASWRTARYKGLSGTTLIGSSSLVGTINKCKIYEKALDETAIRALMGVA